MRRSLHSVSVVALVAFLSNGKVATGGTHGTQSRVPVAMAMEGGGFRALSVDAGLVAGLLSFVSWKNKVKHPTMSSTALLKRFDIFSTVSGSSWFFSSLAYSNRFHSLVEGMAASPSTAALQFKDDWLDPWLKATDVYPSKFDPLRDLVMILITKLLGKGDEDAIFTLQYFLATRSSWNEFVEVLLASTASIDENMTLASPVDTWVNGKFWFADHTLLLPNKENKARLFQSPLGLPSVTYVGQSAESFPLYVPAKFSMKLGMGVNYSSRFPYIAASAVPSLKDFSYEGIIVPVIDQKSAVSKPLDKDDLTGGVLVRNTGSLPIIGVASASSAAFGSAAVMGSLVNGVEAVFNTDMTPWVSIAPNGASFQSASSLVERLKAWGGVNRASIDNLASSAVHGVIDGGFSDGTGISHAVAAGAGEVLVVLNSQDTNDPFYVELLCKDGPAPKKPGLPKELFPVFETLASSVGNNFSKFHNLSLPLDTKYLTVFAVGTLHLVTADNQYFGITAGRSITVHVVNLASTLNIGTFENYVNYAALAQEVIQAIIAKDNADFVTETLLPMVLGSGRGAETGAIWTVV